jgi:hypothetical protein
LADTWDYYVSFTVTDNTTTDRTALPILTGINAQSLIDAGYLDANGNQTAMYESDTSRIYGIATSNVSLFISDLQANQERAYRLYTNNVPAASQDIITGYNGYITFVDDPDIELGANFTIEQSGWIDTSVPALYGWASPTGFQDPSAAWSTEAQAYDNETSTKATDSVAAGVWSEPLILTCNSTPINAVRYYMTGNPAIETDIRIEVYRDGAYYLIYSGTPTLDSWHMLPLSQSYNVTQARWYHYNASGGIRVNGPNELQFHQVPRGTIISKPDSFGVWVAEPNQISAMVVGGASGNTTVNATSVTSGDMVFRISGNATTLDIAIDGLLVDSQTLSANATDNTANWTVGYGDTVPYLDYYKQWALPTAASFIPLAWDSASPINLTLGGLSSWNTVNVTQWVPPDATGVIVNWLLNGGQTEIGLRMPGSTDNRTNYGVSQQMWAMVGVSALTDNVTFEEWHSSVLGGLLRLRLVGYTLGGVTFLTNGVSRTPGVDFPGPNVWNDIDCSATAPAGTEGLIFEVTSNATQQFGLRNNGSTDTISGDLVRHSWAVVGCDANRISEGYFTGGTTRFHLIGYITEGATFFTNSENVSMTTLDTWETISPATVSNAGMVFVEESAVGTYVNKRYSLRSEGNTEDNFDPYFSNGHMWGIIESTDNGTIEGKINSLNVDFAITGYSSPPASANVIWYEPLAMITSPTVPDRWSGDQDGIITWGINPPGIEITVSGITSFTSTTSVSTTSDTAVAYELETAGEPEGWFVSGTYSGVLTPEILQVFSDTATDLGMPVQSLWAIIWFGIAVALGLSVVIFTGSTLLALIIAITFLWAGTNANIIDFGLVALVIIMGVGTLYLVKQH